MVPAQRCSAAATSFAPFNAYCLPTPRQTATGEYWSSLYSAGEHQTVVHILGNLAMIPGRLNSSLSNLPFPNKRESLFACVLVATCGSAAVASESTASHRCRCLSLCCSHANNHLAQAALQRSADAGFRRAQGGGGTGAAAGAAGSRRADRLGHGCTAAAAHPAAASAGAQVRWGSTGGARA